MASFAIFNYQFAKIMKRAEEGRLFPDDGLDPSADETFPKRQEILDDIINKDFLKEQKITFVSKFSGEKEYIHRHIISPTDGISIMRIANMSHRACHRVILTYNSYKKDDNFILK